MESRLRQPGYSRKKAPGERHRGDSSLPPILNPAVERSNGRECLPDPMMSRPQRYGRAASQGREERRDSDVPRRADHSLPPLTRSSSSPAEARSESRQSCGYGAAGHASRNDAHAEPSRRYSGKSRAERSGSRGRRVEPPYGMDATPAPGRPPVDPRHAPGSPPRREDTRQRYSEGASPKCAHSQEQPREAPSRRRPPPAEGYPSRKSRGAAPERRGPEQEMAPPRSDSPPVGGARSLNPVQLAEKAAALSEMEQGEQIPCRHCGRKFNAEAHKKHVKICQTVFQKKRKVFNTVDHRLPEDCPELEHVRKNAARQARKGVVGIETKKDEVKTKWRAKSAAFRAAMKNARVVKECQAQGRPLSEMPVQYTPQELDTRVPCPHCGRKFGEEQAARHIPHCAKAKARPNAVGQTRNSGRPPPPRDAAARVPRKR